MAERSYLFLQGPSSPFMARVAGEVRARGHRACRINLCPGDALFWRAGAARFYRGRLDDWPDYVEAFIERQAISDLVLLADGRPYQSRAIAVAARRGLRVHVIEHGYLRPDWITVERDGMNSFSRFPREAPAVRALSAGRPLPSLEPIEPESFLRYAAWDVAYHGANMLAGWLLTPHYVRYMIDHPIKEYAGWALKLLRAKATARRAEATVAAALARPGPLFLMPLQLATDLQIRLHSPFPHLSDAVAWIVASFAAHAPADATLLFKVHPLDAGWDRWPTRIGQLAAEHGIADRVFVADGGSLDALLVRAAGVVTVNSTVGLTALRAGVPLAVLGNAVYDIDGLSDGQPLAGFWTAPRRPDRQLFDDFLRALTWATQVRGEFTAETSMAIGAREVAARLTEDDDRLAPVPRPGKIGFRRAAEWALETRAR